jgi:hypothetical protein
MEAFDHNVPILIKLTGYCNKIILDFILVAAVMSHLLNAVGSSNVSKKGSLLLRVFRYPDIAQMRFSWAASPSPFSTRCLSLCIEVSSGI